MHEIFVEILERRYAECDEAGHQKPIEEKNYCDYCYRHLHYTTPKNSAIIEERKKLPSEKIPYNDTIDDTSDDTSITDKILRENSRSFLEVLLEDFS